jgi:hypothetical protein
MFAAPGMPQVQKRHTITNDTAESLVIFTEPEGQDFWLLPGESLEVVAEAALPEDEFRLVRLANGYQVWPAHKMGYISAWLGEQQLPCGHQRPAIEPMVQLSYREYLEMLDGGVTTAEATPELIRAAEGQAEVLWPELNLGEWRARKQKVEKVAVCSDGRQLVHVRASRQNSFLILVVPPQQLRATGYLLFDTGAETSEMRFSCPEFNIDRIASKADIYEFIPRLIGKRNPFAILGASPGTYLQAYAEGDLFDVEFQLMSTASHYALVERVDAKTVIQIFLSYAFGKKEWARDFKWQRMVL